MISLFSDIELAFVVIFRANEQHMHMYEAIQSHIYGVKAWIRKNINFENFDFVISQLNMHPILNNLVSTPYTYTLIMGCRHKNFYDWMHI